MFMSMAAYVHMDFGSSGLDLIFSCLSSRVSYFFQGSVSFSTCDAETGVDKKYQEITTGGYVCQLQVLKMLY